MITKLGRRDFARLLGITTVGTAISSTSFLPRLHAAPPAFARAERVLILNLYGGMRSSAAFLASSVQRYNPWDIIPDVPVPFSLGKLLDDHILDGPGGLQEEPPPDSQYTLSEDFGTGAQVPRLREMAHRFSVLGTWNEARGDHLASQIEETTGIRGGGTQGILTRIHQGIAAQREVEIPPFHIRPSTPWFASAPDEAVRFAPITLRGPFELPSETVVPEDLRNGTAGDYRPGLNFPLDPRYVTELTSANRTLADSMAAMREQSIQLAAELSEPWLNTGNADDIFRGAAFGEVLGRPLTNQMLFEALCKGLPGQDESGVTFDRLQDIQNIACALRCLQLGSPAVAVELGQFDLHSGEMTAGPPLYRFLGQSWATLHYLLSNIPEPTDPSVSMLDRTLVVTTSEFSRDGGAIAGFNGGEGSDHGTDYSCMYLAHAIMGAGIGEGALHGGVDITDYNARNADVRHTSQDFLGTILYALGIDPNHEEWGYTRARPIQGLWGET